MSDICILKTGLTIGFNMYRAGDVVPLAKQTQTLIEFANGKLHVGERWAEWVQTSTRPPVVSPPVVQSPVVSPPVVSPPVVSAPTVLADLIKQRVIEGKNKTEIIRELAEPEDVSQRQVATAFDELIALGQIIKSGKAGEYGVVG